VDPGRRGCPPTVPNYGSMSAKCFRAVISHLLIFQSLSERRTWHFSFSRRHEWTQYVSIQPTTIIKLVFAPAKGRSHIHSHLTFACVRPRSIDYAHCNDGTALLLDLCNKLRQFIDGWRMTGYKYNAHAIMSVVGLGPIPAFCSSDTSKLRLVS